LVKIDDNGFWGLCAAGRAPILRGFRANATFGASSGTGVFDILGLYLGSNLFTDLSSNLFYSGGWNLRNTTYDGWMPAMNVTDDAAGQWGVYPAAPGTNPATLTPFLTIDSEGQVGIGTTSPAHPVFDCLWNHSGSCGLGLGLREKRLVD
jgi:hypothetical protein